MRLIAPGRVNTATTDVPTADLLVAAGSVGRKPLVVQGVAGQTANLFETQISTGALRTTIAASGELTIRRSSTSIVPMGAAAAVALTQLDATANNWCEVAFYGTGGSVAGAFAGRIVDHPNGYGDAYIHLRSAAGYQARLRVPSTGGLHVYGDAGTTVATVSSVGAIAATNTILQTHSETDPGATIHSFRTNRTTTYTADTAFADSSNGMYSTYTVAGAGNKTAVSVSAMMASVNNTGTGSVAAMRGISAVVGNSGTGVVSNAYGLFLSMNDPVGGVTNAFGLQISGFGRANIANSVGIDVRALTGTSTTSVGVRIAVAGTRTLWVGYDVNPTTAAGGISFGSSADTTLYRSAANTLTTGVLDLNKNEAQNLVTHKLATAPATPVEGQRYYDTATKNERVWDGTKWTDLCDVWVGPGAPTGTPTTGDLWYDTDDVAPIPPGTELAYVQITANVTVPTNTEATSLEIISSGARTYDGSPIIIEFYSARVDQPSAAGSQILLMLWDGATNLGWLSQNLASSPVVYGPVCLRRRLTPTAGTHTYRVTAYSLGGATTGQVCAGVGGPATHVPAFIRVTRA